MKKRMLGTVEVSAIEIRLYGLLSRRETLNR